MCELKELFETAEYRTITPNGVIAVKGLKAVIKTALSLETTKVSVRVSKTPGWSYELCAWSNDQKINVWLPMEPV